MGFEPLGYQGLETGNRRYAKHAVKQNKIVFVFVSAYETNDESHGLHLMTHGDGVKDVAFEVEDIEAIFKLAKERGAEVVKELWEESDEFGTVKFATIKTVSCLTIKMFASVHYFLLLLVRRYYSYICGSNKL